MSDNTKQYLICPLDGDEPFIVENINEAANYIFTYDCHAVCLTTKQHVVPCRDETTGETYGELGGAVVIRRLEV